MAPRKKCEFTESALSRATRAVLRGAIKAGCSPQRIEGKPDGTFTMFLADGQSTDQGAESNEWDDV